MLLGGDVTAVSVLRSLGRAGVRVHALGSGGDDPARNSRYCTEYVDVDAEDVQASWMTWLADGPAGAVVLPCGDDGLELIARNRSTLEEMGYAPGLGNDDAALAALDKARTYELASAAGIDVPRTLVAGLRQDAEAIEGRIAYPCGVKPTHAHIARSRGFLGKLVVANNREELQAALSRTEALGIEVLVTELIPGPDDSLFIYCCYEDGVESLWSCTLHKLRQAPVGFGIASYITAEWSPEVAEVGRQFVQALGFQGLALVEFKRSSRDGRLVLIECNNRFATYNDIFRHMGMDMSLLAYNRTLGRPGPPGRPAKYGVYMWFAIDDARSFLHLRRDGTLKFNGWVRSLLHRQRFAVFSLRDPWPAVSYLVGRIWHKLQRRLAARRPSSES